MLSPEHDQSAIDAVRGREESWELNKDIFNRVNDVVNKLDEYLRRLVKEKAEGINLEAGDEKLNSLKELEAAVERLIGNGEGADQGETGYENKDIFNRLHAIANKLDEYLSELTSKLSKDINLDVVKERVMRGAVPDPEAVQGPIGDPTNIKKFNQLKELESALDSFISN